MEATLRTSSRAWKLRFVNEFPDTTEVSFDFEGGCFETLERGTRRVRDPVLCHEDTDKLTFQLM